MKGTYLYIAIKFDKDKKHLILIVRGAASKLPKHYWRFIGTVVSTKNEIAQHKLSWRKKINNEFGFNFQTVEVI